MSLFLLLLFTAIVSVSSSGYTYIFPAVLFLVIVWKIGFKAGYKQAGYKQAIDKTKRRIRTR